MTKGAVAARAPVAVDVEAGSDYYWCACGLSKNQPFCDGSHKGSDFAPMKWSADTSETRYFCACKQTGGQPFCDGSHNALEADEKPVADTIEQRENGPFVIKGEVTITGPDGERIETKAVTALCRCGQSRNKPFCDGSHKEAGYTSANETDRKDGRVFSYEGRDVTVHFNKLLCSHAGECGRLNRAVFNTKQRPWVQPDEGTVDSIREVVAACPSGALTMSMPNEAPQHVTGNSSAIHIQKHGPYWVSKMAVEGAEFAESGTKDKYVLCRCGLSKNKPFCDGTHYDEKWRDDA